VQGKIFPTELSRLVGIRPPPALKAETSRRPLNISEQNAPCILPLWRAVLRDDLEAFLVVFDESIEINGYRDIGETVGVFDSLVDSQLWVNSIVGVSVVLRSGEFVRRFVNNDPRHLEPWISICEGELDVHAS
jgi:hypothetical protein